MFGSGVTKWWSADLLREGAGVVVAGEGQLDAAGFFCICNIKFSIPN